MPLRDHMCQTAPQGSTGEPIQERSPEDWIARGEAACSAGSHREAGRCFENALRADPFSARAHNGLSLIHWCQGNTVDALSFLTRALELDPDDPVVLLHCSEVFDKLGKRQDAEEILRSYLVRRPWDTVVRAALEKIQEGPAAQAPTNDVAALFNEQGERQFEQGRTDRAILCFEIALDHNPDYFKAHSNLGAICWREGSLEKALSHLQRALELAPEDSDVLYNSSRAIMAAGDWDTAASLLKMYLQKNIQDEEAWSEYSDLIRRMDRSRWTSEGLSADAAEVYLEMGKALAQAKDILGASEAFERALRLDPGRAEIYYELGRLHIELGQANEALDILLEGLRISPGHKESVLSAGEILESQGQRDAARDLYQACLAGGGGDAVRAALAQLSAAA